MPKFKIGDHITAIYKNRGFERVVIYDIDDKYYYCYIPCGRATIPIKAEVNYQLNPETK